MEHCPPEMQELIQGFSDLFEEPKGLPPKRSFDHTIPLLPGAQPINVHPYRYSPEQMNEIERQIYEMLANGIIRPNSSPFSSPVILVAKKVLTWRLCVDYINVNAVTMKNRYPIPIVEELCQELRILPVWTCDRGTTRFVCETRMSQRPHFRLTRSTMSTELCRMG